MAPIQDLEGLDTITLIQDLEGLDTITLIGAVSQPHRIKTILVLVRRS